MAESLDELTAPHNDHIQLLIALSGGVDSVVLTELASKWAAAQKTTTTVRAVYINHGLQAASGDWAQSCENLCKRLGIAFKSIPVNVNLDERESPEAAARAARYEAFVKELKSDEYLCTAHHLDDQAETVLLRLFRGAGVRGLSAIAPTRQFGSGFLIRPLLQIGRDEIVRYAESQQLVWVEDPHNHQMRYDRNLVRHQILPLINEKWSGASARIAAAAAHCKDATGLLDQLAVDDIDQQSSIDRIEVERLRGLSTARLNNALRYWIHCNGFEAPTQVKLNTIIDNLLKPSNDSHGRVEFGRACLARYAEHVYLGDRIVFESASSFDYRWRSPETPLYIEELNWSLDARRYAELQPYLSCELQVKSRMGGERIERQGAAHSQSIKSYLQQTRVPPWQRSRLVLVYRGDTLVCACGPDFQTSLTRPKQGS